MGGRGLVARAARIGSWIGFAALGAGLALAGGSAIVAGDWWLAREPWIGLGLWLITAGLWSSAICLTIRDIVEPVGRWRLLAVVPAIVVGFFWWVLLVFGPATTGFGGPDHDIPTILYSVPEYIELFVIGTLLLGAPLIAARIAQRAGSTAPGASTLGD